MIIGKFSWIKIAIVGAGSVGAMLADELIQNPRATYEPVCFVDVDEGKVGREVYGVPVLDSRADLSAKLQEKGFLKKDKESE